MRSSQIVNETAIEVLLNPLDIGDEGETLYSQIDHFSELMVISQRLNSVIFARRVLTRIFALYARYQAHVASFISLKRRRCLVQ